VSNGTSYPAAVVIDTMQPARKALWVTRPSMLHYAATRAPICFRWRTNLFDLVKAGIIKSEPGRSFPAGRCRAKPTARWNRARTTGATVLVP
jgi:NADPH2:quinone reductase